MASAGIRQKRPYGPLASIVPPFVQAFEQRRRRAAGHVADRDLHRLARAQRVVVDRGQRIAALGRGAVGVVEMHLDELAGDEVQRLAVVAHETSGGATVGASMRRATSLSGKWMMAKASGFWCNTAWRRAPTRGRLYYRLADPRRPLAPKLAMAFTMSPTQPPQPTRPRCRVRDLRKTYDNGVRGAQGRVARRAPGRFLRPARPQRRRQVDPDRHRQLAGQQDRGRGRGLRRRPRARPRRGDAPDRPGAAGNQLQHVREAASTSWCNYAGFYGVPRAEALRARRRGTQARAAVGQGAR